MRASFIGVVRVVRAVIFCEVRFMDMSDNIIMEVVVM